MGLQFVVELIPITPSLTPQTVAPPVVEYKEGDDITVTGNAEHHLTQTSSFSGFSLSGPAQRSVAFSATMMEDTNEYLME